MARLIFLEAVTTISPGMLIRMGALIGRRALNRIIKVVTNNLFKLIELNPFLSSFESTGVVEIVKPSFGNQAERGL